MSPPFSSSSVSPSVSCVLLFDSGMLSQNLITPSYIITHKHTDTHREGQTESDSVLIKVGQLKTRAASFFHVWTRGQRSITNRPAESHSKPLDAPHRSHQIKQTSVCYNVHKCVAVCELKLRKVFFCGLTLEKVSLLFGFYLWVMIHSVLLQEKPLNFL